MLIEVSHFDIDFWKFSKQKNVKKSNYYSGAPDKVADDMVNRICRDNNKPLGSDDPGVKCNQSYLILSPALTPASSQAVLDPDNEEPDIHRDDYHYRSIRDFQVKFKNEHIFSTLSNF